MSYPYAGSAGSCHVPEKSHALMELLHTYTDDIEQLSIDECFLDFTPIAHRYESPLAAAKIISANIKSRFGLPLILELLQISF